MVTLLVSTALPLGGRLAWQRDGIAGSKENLPFPGQAG
jgi:hypothetical protein